MNRMIFFFLENVKFPNLWCDHGPVKIYFFRSACICSRKSLIIHLTWFFLKIFSVYLFFCILFYDDVLSIVFVIIVFFLLLFREEFFLFCFFVVSRISSLFFFLTLLFLIHSFTVLKRKESQVWEREREKKT